MRLIDAEAMKQVLRDRLKDDSGPIAIMLEGAFVGLIDAQPTAYDVDKVVEELWAEHQLYDSIFDPTIDLYDLGKSHAYRDAIDIVKGGLIHDDSKKR